MGHVLVNPAIHSHPSFRVLPARATWAWVASICWLSRHGRANEFPKASASSMDATPKDAAGLIREGLWVEVGDAIGVPQFVEPAYGRAMQLWKFAPLETARPKIPTALRHQVYERDGHACLHCGATELLTLDHIHPFSLGGKDTFDNLQTLCRSCNSRKGARV